MNERIREIAERANANPDLILQVFYGEGWTETRISEMNRNPNYEYRLIKINEKNT